MNTGELQWHRSIPGNLPSSNEVHVWAVSLDISSIENENMLGILSADELARAGQFHFEKDQKHFVAARGILRQLLGLYLKIKSNQLRFDYNSNGKPQLAKEMGYDTLHFNLSHSNRFALYGITAGRSIGIDIEYIQDEVAAREMAQHFFSASEIHSLERVPKSELGELFYRYWTRKEAFIKATGEGISFPLDQCDVTLINGKTLSPVVFHGDQRKYSDWYSLDLFPCQGYAAAIAVEGSDWDLSCWQYSI